MVLSLKGGKEMTLRIDQIQLTDYCQMRVQLDQIAVANYTEEVRERLEDNQDSHESSCLGRLKVCYDPREKKYYLFDGFHRIAAYRAAGLNHVECLVWEGDLNTAQLLSFQANLDHGVPLSQEDKRKKLACALAHPDLQGMRNIDLARQIGLTSATIGRLREKMASGVDIVQRKKGSGRPRRDDEDECESSVSTPTTPISPEPLRETPDRRDPPKPAQPATDLTGLPRHLHEVFGPARTLLEESLALAERGLDGVLAAGRSLDGYRIVNPLTRNIASLHLLQRHGKLERVRQAVDATRTCLENAEEHLIQVTATIRGCIPGKICPHCHGMELDCSVCGGCGYLPQYAIIDDTISVGPSVTDDDIDMT